MDEKELYHWDRFVVWAKSDGVSMESPDDWEPWWGCWMAAIQANVSSN